MFAIVLLLFPAFAVGTLVSPVAVRLAVVVVVAVKLDVVMADESSEIFLLSAAADSSDALLSSSLVA